MLEELVEARMDEQTIKRVNRELQNSNSADFAPVIKSAPAGAKAQLAVDKSAASDALGAFRDAVKLSLAPAFRVACAKDLLEALVRVDNARAACFGKERPATVVSRFIPILSGAIDSGNVAIEFGAAVSKPTEKGAVDLLGDELMKDIDKALAPKDGPLATFISSARSSWQRYLELSAQKNPNMLELGNSQREFSQNMDVLATADTQRKGPYMDLAMQIRNAFSPERRRQTAAVPPRR